MDSSASMRTFLIAASSAEVGERAKRLLHGTGKPLLGLDVVTDLVCLPEYVDSWKPHVLVVDAGLKLSKEDWGVPIATFDPLAFDPQTLADEILHLQASDPAEAPLSIAPGRPAHGVAIGFQGVKGGVGTTTVTAGVAEAAAQCGYRAAIVDLAGDCAVTLRARADEQDGHLFLTESGVMIVQGAADLRQVWRVLSKEYDVVVVDAGRAGEYVAKVRTLIRLGVLFFLVVTDREIEFLQPGRYPGYRLFLNRQPDRRWWQWDVAGGAPNDPELTDRVNRGEFGTFSPFLLGMREFTTRVVQREIV